MNNNWEVKRLGDIASVKGGKRVPKGYKLQSEKTRHPYITVSDFNDNGTISLGYIRYINDEVFEKIKRYTISTDDLYISIAGTIGKTGIVPPELDGANLTENACKLVFNKDIDKEFIHYFTKTTDFIEQAGLNTRTAAQPKLALERLKTIKLQLPEYPEQQRIVAILDEAFSAIAKAKDNAEKNLQNARELFESYLQSVFANSGDGWMIKALDQVGRLQTGTTPKSSEKGMKGNFIPFIKPGDFIKDGSLNYDNEGLSELGLSNSRLIKAGSALMVCIGATIGKTGFCERDIATNQQINSVTPKEGISGKFLFYQMLTKRLQERVIHYSGQATLPIINKSKWGSLTVVVPPSIKEQQSIVAKLDSLSAETQSLESIYRQKLTDIDELKKSILQKAFAGELHTEMLAA